MLTAHDPTGRLARWHLTLQQYDYEIKFLPGSQNSVADAISRLNNIPPENDEDETLSKNLVDIERPQPVCLPILPNEDLSKEQDKDPEIVKIKEELRRSNDSPLHERFVVEENILFRINPANTRHGKMQICIPRHQQHKLIHDFHAPNHMAHFGINSTLNKLSQRYYFKGMCKQVVHLINNCVKYNELKGKTQKAPIFSIALTNPFEELVCDLLGLFPPTKPIYCLIYGHI